MRLFPALHAFIAAIPLCGLVNAQTASLLVSPSTLNFAVSGGSTLAIPQQLDVNSSGDPIVFVVGASSVGGWLTVVPGTPIDVNGDWQATTPTAVSVFVNASNLQEGNY